MESPIAFCILHQTISLFIKLTAIAKIFISILRKVILINEVIARVIRRIDIDHLHFAEIGFLQQLQFIQIIALDVNIFRVDAARRAISAHRLFTVKTQRLCNRLIRQHNRLFLVRPGELIAFLRTLYHRGRDFLTQHIRINGTHHIAIFVLGFCHCIRKQCSELCEILVRQIRRMHFKMFHVLNPPAFVDIPAVVCAVQISSLAAVPSTLRFLFSQSIFLIFVSAPVTQGEPLWNRLFTGVADSISTFILTPGFITKYSLAYRYQYPHRHLPEESDSYLHGSCWL